MCPLISNLGDKAVTLTSTKTKDHESPAPITFKPIVVDLGIVDEDKKPVTSLVLVESDESPTKDKQMPKAQRITLDALRTVIVEGDASETAWKAKAYSLDISSSDNPDSQRKAFDRAKQHLVDHGLVAIKDGVYSIA